jgi:peptidoglycan/xylan/chitin deacetylase (PgdA/CDA1 family)
MRRQLSLFLLVLLLWGSCVPASAAPRIVYRYAGNTEGQRIALTFDDGPHPRYTAEILDILKQYNAKATFFCVGSNAEVYPDLIRREIAEGHEIANHTYNHYNVAKLSCEALMQDIADCNDTLERITGRHLRLFRPPEGVCSESVKSICEKEGMTIVLWSVDTRDWAHTPADEILANVKSNVRNGSIILMHDFIGKNSPTPAVLRRMIPMLQELGYELVTVSALVGEAE